MKKITNLFLVCAALLLAVSAFGQSPTPFGTPAPEGVTVVDTTALVTIALGVSGIVSTIFLTFIRNKFELSSTTTYFIYMAASAAIAFGVTYFNGGWNSGSIASSFAVVFAVGQAVYQSLIKGSEFGELGNTGDPPSATNESAVLEERSE